MIRKTGTIGIDVVQQTLAFIIVHGQTMLHQFFLGHS